MSIQSLGSSGASPSQLKPSLGTPAKSAAPIDATGSAPPLDQPASPPRVSSPVQSTTSQLQLPADNTLYGSIDFQGTHYQVIQGKITSDGQHVVGLTDGNTVTLNDPAHTQVSTDQARDLDSRAGFNLSHDSDDAMLADPGNSLALQQLAVNGNYQDLMNKANSLMSTDFAAARIARKLAVQKLYSTPFYGDAATSGGEKYVTALQEMLQQVKTIDPALAHSVRMYMVDAIKNQTGGNDPNAAGRLRGLAQQCLAEGDAVAAKQANLAADWAQYSTDSVAFSNRGQFGNFGAPTPPSERYVPTPLPGVKTKVRGGPSNSVFLGDADFSGIDLV